MARFQILFIAAFVLGAAVSSDPSPSPAVQAETELQKEEQENSRYKTLEANATLLKLLVDNKDGVTGSEIFDMLQSRDDTPSHVDLPTFPEDAEDSKTDASAPIVPDFQAEVLQRNDEDTVVRKDSRQRIVYAGARGEPVGTAAGIMVLATCSVVSLAYIGLIVWRRIYLKRNGLKHEILRNEEVAETRIEL